MPAAFAHSCEINIDELNGLGSMAVRGVRKK